MKPWQRIDPTHVTTVGWRSIVTKTFIMPDGKQATFDTFGSEGQEYVVIIGLTPDNHVLIGRQFRVGPEKVMDELPGGYIDPGETPEEAARREFLEETGYHIGGLTYLGNYDKDPYMNATWHVMFATDCQPLGPQELEAEEHIEVDLISIPDLIKNAKTNKTTEAVAVLMAYDLLIERL